MATEMINNHTGYGIGDEEDVDISVATDFSSSSPPKKTCLFCGKRNIKGLYCQGHNPNSRKYGKLKKLIAFIFPWDCKKYSGRGNNPNSHIHKKLNLKQLFTFIFPWGCKKCGAPTFNSRKYCLNHRPEQNYEKRKIQMKNWWDTHPEEKEKRRKKMTESPPSKIPAVAKKIADSQKKRYENPEERTKTSVAVSKYHQLHPTEHPSHNPKTREKHSKTMQRLRKDEPERWRNKVGLPSSLEYIIRDYISKNYKKYTYTVNTPHFGHPDIMFDDIKIVVFVDGCFWHSCKTCGHKDYQKNYDYTVREHDTRITQYYQNLSYTVIRIWEHEINSGDFSKIDSGLCFLIQENTLEEVK